MCITIGNAVIKYALVLQLHCAEISNFNTGLSHAMHGPRPRPLRTTHMFDLYTLAGACYVTSHIHSDSLATALCVLVYSRMQCVYVYCTHAAATLAVWWYRVHARSRPFLRRRSCAFGILSGILFLKTWLLSTFVNHGVKIQETNFPTGIYDQMAMSGDFLMCHPTATGWGSLRWENFQKYFFCQKIRFFPSKNTFFCCWRLASLRLV